MTQLTFLNEALGYARENKLRTAGICIATIGAALIVTGGIFYSKDSSIANILFPIGTGLVVLGLLIALRAGSQVHPTTPAQPRPPFQSLRNLSSPSQPSTTGFFSPTA